MTLLHAAWINDPPAFTPEQFQALILDDAKRLGIGDALMDEYILPLFQEKLCPSNLRAFARVNGDRLMIRLQELDCEDTVVVSDEERELRNVLQLVRAIGICATCVNV